MLHLLGARATCGSMQEAHNQQRCQPSSFKTHPTGCHQRKPEITARTVLFGVEVPSCLIRVHKADVCRIVVCLHGSTKVRSTVSCSSDHLATQDTVGCTHRSASWAACGTGRSECTVVYMFRVHITGPFVPRPSDTGSIELDRCDQASDGNQTGLLGIFVWHSCSTSSGTGSSQHKAPK